MPQLNRFALLQKNILDRRSGATHEELRIAIVTWIERTYQKRRWQTALADCLHRIRDHHDHSNHSGCVT